MDEVFGVRPQDILSFWRDAGEERWYRKDAAFDEAIRARYLEVWEQASAGKLSSWETSDEGALALVIVLDQFPRNMFRDDTKTYCSDALAREVASRAIARGADSRVDAALREFFYLPFMHSEYLPDQEHCLELARSYGEEEFARDAEQHAEIICRFGRFPHRNAIMGRSTTAQEQAFLDAGGFAG